MKDTADYQVIIPAAGSSRRLAQMTENCPKSLLAIEGKTIIERSLDTLNQKGFRRVTFVVGYMREVFTTALGERYKNLALDYVVSENYAATGNGWTLYLTRESWQREKRPVVFMDADNLYDPAMIDLMMVSADENIMLVDDHFSAADRDEELVTGVDGSISGLVRGLSSAYPDYLGGFVGINRFSVEFMGRLYPFMESFFDQNGPRYQYERVFHRFIHDTSEKLNYLCTGGLNWVNVNHEEDYRQACKLVKRFDAASRRTAPN